MPRRCPPTPTRGRGGSRTCISRRAGARALVHVVPVPDSGYPCGLGPHRTELQLSLPCVLSQRPRRYAAFGLPDFVLRHARSTTAAFLIGWDSVSGMSGPYWAHNCHMERSVKHARRFTVASAPFEYKTRKCNRESVLRSGHLSGLSNLRNSSRPRLRSALRPGLDLAVSPK